MNSIEASTHTASFTVWALRWSPLRNRQHERWQACRIEQIEQFGKDKDDWFRTLAVARNNGIKLITFETVSLFANYPPNDGLGESDFQWLSLTFSDLPRWTAPLDSVAVHWTMPECKSLKFNAVRSTFWSPHSGVHFLESTISEEASVLWKDANREDAGTVSIWLFLNHILRLLSQSGTRRWTFRCFRCSKLFSCIRLFRFLRLLWCSRLDTWMLSPEGDLDAFKYSGRFRFRRFRFRRFQCFGLIQLPLALLQIPKFGAAHLGRHPHLCAPSALPKSPLE